MKKYPEFWSVLAGPSIGLLLGFMAIACIAAIAVMAYDAKKRDPLSSRTPVKFSLTFWFADNILRILGTVALIYIFIRVAYEYIPGAWMLLASIGIGFGSDKLAIIGKNIGVLTSNKISQTIAEKINAKEEQKP